MEKKARYLLGKLYELFKGIYTDELIDLKWVRIYISQIITDEFQNYAEIETLEDNFDERISKIEEEMLKRDRKPAIYLTPFSQPSNISENLVRKKYRLSLEDAWMVLRGDYKLPTWEAIEQIKHISPSEKSLNDFEQVITKGYSGEKSADNPYGRTPMTNFIKATKRGFNNSLFVNRLEGYIVYDGKKPVATSLLLHDNEAGYIAGVASIPEVRGKGFGKLVSQYACKRARHLGCKTIFLGTEVGSRNEEFYKRIGFQTEFTASCYVK